VQFLWSFILVTGYVKSKSNTQTFTTHRDPSLFFLPETPRYLIKTDCYEEAAKSLAKLRRLPTDHPAIVEELNEIQANHLYEMSLGKSTYVECFKGTLGKRLITGCLLQALQQLTGVNFICTFASFPRPVPPPPTYKPQSTMEPNTLKMPASKTHSSTKSSQTR